MQPPHKYFFGGWVCKKANLFGHISLQNIKCACAARMGILYLTTLHYLLQSIPVKVPEKQTRDKKTPSVEKSP